MVDNLPQPVPTSFSTPIRWLTLAGFLLAQVFLCGGVLCRYHAGARIEWGGCERSDEGVCEHSDTHTGDPTDEQPANDQPADPQPCSDTTLAAADASNKTAPRPSLPAPAAIELPSTITGLRLNPRPSVALKTVADPRPPGQRENARLRTVILLV